MLLRWVLLGWAWCPTSCRFAPCLWLVFDNPQAPLRQPPPARHARIFTPRQEAGGRSLLGPDAEAALEARLQAARWDLCYAPGRCETWERLAVEYHVAADDLLVSLYQTVSLGNHRELFVASEYHLAAQWHVAADDLLVRPAALQSALGACVTLTSIRQQSVCSEGAVPATASAHRQPAKLHYTPAPPPLVHPQNEASRVLTHPEWKYQPGLQRRWVGLAACRRYQRCMQKVPAHGGELSRCPGQQL